MIVVGARAAGASGEADDVKAGADLQAYLRKITGADVPIVYRVPARGPSVRIGVFGQRPVRGWSGASPPPDGFVIEPRGRTLFIVGGNARGALYGVYDFLEKDLGVRWFMPGELGEDVVPARTVRLPTKRREGRPAFQAVAGFDWAGGAEAAVWEKHNKALVGSHTAFFGHNWSNIIAPNPENLATHPEWFALKDGRRTRQLCSTHDDVVRVTVEKARAFFDQHPDALTYSISPNDGYDFCECPRCKAIDELYGVKNGSLSDRLTYYANQVLDELEKTHPGKRVGILAYASYVEPPRVVVPHPDFATLITRMPWEFCHVHSLDDPSCAINQRFVRYVKGWTKVCRHVGVYDYYGHFHVFAPWPLVHTIRRDLRFLRTLGVQSFMSETQQHWANQGLNFYIGAKLAWNPDADTDALLDDYFSRFYGRAAAPMRRYWMQWEEAMVATGSGAHGGYEWLRMFTPELVADGNRLLTEAERLSADDPNKKVGQRVGFARRGFRFTEAWARMRWAADKRDWVTAVTQGEEALKRLRETEGLSPQAFWVDLAVSQTEALITQYREAGLSPGNSSR